MAKKYALFAFNGDPMCFIHVLLNALDLHEKGFEVKIIIEGSATKLANEFRNEDNPMHSLYKNVEDEGLLGCFCKACSNKMGSLDTVEKLGFPTCSEMKGHPSMGKYIEEGYEIITF